LLPPIGTLLLLLLLGLRWGGGATFRVTRGHLEEAIPLSTSNRAR
jgi:hypothetical protein